MKTILALAILLISFNNFADEDEVKLPEGVSSYEPEEKSFKLRAEVLKHYSIKCTSSIQSGEGFEVPLSSIVHSLAKVQVFTCMNEEFRSVDVKIIKTNSSTATIVPIEKEANFKVVISGANYLKTIELFLKEGPAEGEGH